jgi:hypothetical protein
VRRSAKRRRNVRRFVARKRKNAVPMLNCSVTKNVILAIHARKPLFVNQSANRAVRRNVIHAVIRRMIAARRSLYAPAKNVSIHVILAKRN